MPPDWGAAPNGQYHMAAPRRWPPRARSDEYTIKRLRQRNAEVWLEAENEEYQPFIGGHARGVGVVRYSIRNH